MRSSVIMQEYPQTPLVRLHAPQQASCSSLPSSSVEAQYYTAQQRMSNQQNNQQSPALWNTQSSSQPSDLQARQMPQTWFTDSQNRIHPRNSSSMRATLPNGQFAPLPAAQHGIPTQNLSYHPQTLNRNTGLQQNYMPPIQNVSSTHIMSHTRFSAGYSNAGSAIEQNNLTHEPALSQYQSLNGHHNRMQTAHQPVAQQQTNQTAQIPCNQAQHKMYHNQGQIISRKGNGALYNSVNHFPVTSQRLVTPSQPSNYSHQVGQLHPGNNGTRGQHSSLMQRQTSPYTMENNSASHGYLKHSGNKQQSLTSSLPQPPSHANKHFLVQSQPMQRKNPSSELSSGPQGVAQSQIPLQQGNTIPVSVHRNNAAPPPSYTESIFNNSQVTLRSLLLENCNTQMPVQRYASITTPTHNTAKASYSPTPESKPYCNPHATVRSKELQKESEFQKPVNLKKNEYAFGNPLKAPDVQSFEGMQSRRFQTDPNTERRDGRGEVQYNKDVPETLELVMALHKMIQQSHKAVAVVPPISQQVTSPEKNDHGTTSPDDGLPIKINAVWTLVKDSKNVEQESNARSLSKEPTEELLNLCSVKHPETQERNKPDNGSPVDSLQPETPSTDVPQSKIASNTSQDPVFSASPEDHNNDQTGQSNSSKVQMHHFTLQNFICWLKLLECTPAARVKEPVADLENCLLDLFWDGNKNNISKDIYRFRAEMTDLYSKVSLKEMQTAVFQCLQPKDLLMLEKGSHILKNDTDIPSEEFRSSWLNVAGQPSDIENVLAEPILDFNPTDYAFCRDTLNIYSEPETSRKVIPATTDGEKDKLINKELANLQVCESKCTDLTTDTQQEASKKQGDKNLLKVPVDSNEKSDSLNDGKSKTGCEQVCRDASEDIPSSPEITEQSDVSNDANSSSDSQIIELSLLSFDDARTIFEEYSGCEKKGPSQLCQDETKVSATPDNKSNDFCNSVNRIKFTCPHVIDQDSENFCPRCWEETPLLDLDLDEPQLSPKGGSPNMRTPPRPGCHDQSCSSPAPNVEVTDSDPNPSDAAESCSSLTSTSPVKESHAPVCTESVDFTMMVEEEVCETNGLIGPELANAPSCPQNADNFKVIPEQTKPPRDEVSPPECPPCKKIKLTKTISDPSEDDLFTDIVTRKDSFTKPYPIDHSVILAKDGQNCKDERQERKSSPVKLEKLNAQCLQSTKPDPNVSVCSESKNNSSDSSTFGVNMTITEPVTNLGDSIQSCSSSSGKSLGKEAHRRVRSGSVGVTAQTEPVCEAELPKALSLSQNIEKRKLSIQSHTKNSGEKDSPPRYPPCKKIKVTKSISLSAIDGLFTPDFVVRKDGSTNPHSSVTPPKAGQHCKDEKSSPVKLCPQFVKPDPSMSVCSESKPNSSDSSTFGTFGVNMIITEPDTNLGDSVKSCSSRSGKSVGKEAHRRVRSESVRVTLSLSQSIEKRKLFIQRRTKTSGETDSPPRYPPCKKLKVPKTITIPSRGERFTPGFVKKERSTNPHPCLACADDGQRCKDERRERAEGKKLNNQCPEHSGQAKLKTKIKTSFMSQEPSSTPQPIRLAPNSDVKTQKVFGKPKTGQNKAMKKLALYGFTNSALNRTVLHQCHDRTKSSEAPVYITVTNTPESAKCYTTDAPSAKQKVYSDWSSAYVQTKKYSSSHKHQIPLKIVLKSRIQEQKSLIKERFAIKMKSFTDSGK